MENAMDHNRQDICLINKEAERVDVIESMDTQP